MERGRHVSGGRMGRLGLGAGGSDRFRAGVLPAGVRKSRVGDGYDQLGGPGVAPAIDRLGGRLGEWGGVGAAFVACTAFAVINRRHVVILVTAFLGALLLLSGLTSWAMNVPGVLGTFRSMAAWSVVVVPFLVLVPMVMSCFYQIAEVRRLRIEF